MTDYNGAEKNKTHTVLVFETLQSRIIMLDGNFQEVHPKETVIEEKCTYKFYSSVHIKWKLFFPRECRDFWVSQMVLKEDGWSESEANFIKTEH